ncbi:glutathione peroxidase [Liquorilactobacillus oeni]|uniref:Glutathione peroxidase n=1 Tax=Liquorilactobacillus oeni DSM 19972 TaxID=1423777 RepID=A0A0R1M975_9LACO|nr:glutathione peroxidase [Liquorilactobacillus oeni]KRL04457.1 glutathione peroxidase [Liquorilactobacillus oeni DSM 19972]
MSIYDYEATLENGETYSLKKYENHPLVIVNTATKCGLAPQFKELEKIYQEYHKKGLIVLGFPSNQFHQEVSDSKEAAQSCRTTYGVSFPMHQIHDVNGEKALPLFKYLTSQKPGKFTNAIKWNFTKFLVDEKGQVVERFAPTTVPQKMIPKIEKLLEKQQS